RARGAFAAGPGHPAEAAGNGLAQLVEPISVDGRLLRAGPHDDEVAVPGLKGFEPREQLVALGPALRATDPLLGFTRRKIEPRDHLLLSLLRLEPSLVRGGKKSRRRVAWIEP